MGRVRYAKSLRDLEREAGASMEERDAERHALRTIGCTYETDAEAAQIPEAELISEFDKLEEKQAES